MRKFIELIVIAIVAAFNTGQRLKLTKEQYDARAHALEPVKGEKDVYTVTTRVEFKQGEMIGFYGELSKYERTVLKPVGEDSVDTDPEMTELIDRALELGIKKPELKSVEELKALISELDSAGDTDPDEDNNLEDLDKPELVKMATELGIENADKMSKKELTGIITNELSKSGSTEDGNLEDLTEDELIEMATELGIENADKFDKSALIAEITKKMNEDPE